MYACEQRLANHDGDDSDATADGSAGSSTTRPTSRSTSSLARSLARCAARRRALYMPAKRRGKGLTYGRVCRPGGEQGVRKKTFEDPAEKKAALAEVHKYLTGAAANSHRNKG
jgi:hypothetical protein